MQIAITGLTREAITRTQERANAALFNEERSILIEEEGGLIFLRSANANNEGWRIAQCAIDGISGVVTNRYSMTINTARDSWAAAALLAAVSAEV